jgi:CotH kinase protein/Lamin Tail Domain
MRVLLYLPALIAAVIPALASAQSKADFYDEGTLRSMYLTFSAKTWYGDLIASRLSGKMVKGNLVIDGQLFQQIGVRMTGNNAFLGTASQKKPLSIKMDEFIANQDLMGYENINLHNGFNDPTLMREVIGYSMVRRYTPAPKCNFMKVYINNTYWGLYVNVQQIDKKMIGAWFKGNDGNRYLAEAPVTSGRGKSALQYQGATLQPYKNSYDLKNNAATAVKPWEDVRTVCSVLNNSTTLVTDLPKVFNFDQALWYLAFYNVVANLNGYNTNGSDYYMYHDEKQDILTVVPWDMAGAFGASPGQTVIQATNQSPFLDESKSSRPLLGKTWGVTEWRSRYINHMKTILDQEISWTKIGALVVKHGKLIDTALKTDTKKLYTYQNALDNTTKAVSINAGTYAKTVPGLKQLSDARNVYLRGLNEFKAVAPTISSVKVTPIDPKPNTQVTLTAKVANTVAMGAVTLYYRVFGGFTATPMLDDGKHGDGSANDGVFGAFVPNAVQAPGANVYYYIGAQSAASAGGAVSYAPKHGERDAPRYITQWAIGNSPVSINELMANNTNTIKDSAGEFDDWVELYNSSANAVTVGGMYLTDDPLNSTRWKIPANTQIPAKGTLLIWCDNDLTQGPLHAAFKLTSAGEEVRLFDTDAKTQLSIFKFGAIGPDVSNGWLHDGNTTQMVAYRKWGNRYGKGASPDRVNDPALGVREYWPVAWSNQRMFVEWVGIPRIGGTNAVRSLGGPVRDKVAMMFGTAPLVVHLQGGVYWMIGGLLVGPVFMPTDNNGQGVAVINIPNDAKLIGLKVYFTVGGNDSKGFTLSNGGQIGIAR